MDWEKTMVVVKEVSTKKDIKVFASYPLKLYQDCPYYVPSLSADEINTLNPNKNFSLVHTINSIKESVSAFRGWIVSTTSKYSGLCSPRWSSSENKRGWRLSTVPGGSTIPTAREC